MSWQLSKLSSNDGKLESLFFHPSIFAAISVNAGKPLESYRVELFGIVISCSHLDSRLSPEKSEDVHVGAKAAATFGQH